MIPEQHRDMIERRDARRRQDRKAAELIELAESYYKDGTSYLDSRNATGVPENHNRWVRASEDCWQVRSTIVDGHVKRVGRMRAVGSDVKVTRNGHTTIEPAASFRRSTRRSTVAANVINDRQAARLRALQLAGNHSELATGDA